MGVLQQKICCKMSGFQKKTKRIGARVSDGSIQIGGLTGLAVALGAILVVGSAIGVIVSGVVLSQQIQGITLTNYSWSVQNITGSPVFGMEQIASSSNLGLIRVIRTFLVEKYPTYTRLTLSVGGVLGSFDPGLPMFVNFTNMIEPPYTFPFRTGTFGDSGEPNQIIIGAVPGTNPNPVGIIAVYGVNGGRNLEFVLPNGDATTLVFSTPILFTWALDSSGNLIHGV